MSYGAPERKSKVDWEREVERVVSALNAEVSALDACLGAVLSNKQQAARMPTAIAYFSNPTPATVSHFNALAERYKEEEARATRAVAEHRQKVNMLLAQAARLAGEIERAMGVDERQLRSLRRTNFGRYNGEFLTASNQWDAELTFLGSLFKKLTEAMRTAGERVRKIEQQHAQQAQYAEIPHGIQEDSGAPGRPLHSEPGPKNGPVSLPPLVR